MGVYWQVYVAGVLKVDQIETLVLSYPITYGRSCSLLDVLFSWSGFTKRRAEHDMNGLRC